MRVGIDARELCGRPTGVGRYLAGLLAQWAKSAAAQHDQFVLYAPEPFEQDVASRRFSTRLVPGGHGTWWEQARVARVATHDDLDVWFAPGYTAPIGFDRPVVLVVHDLSFFAHPEWFSLREGVRRRWVTQRSVAAACRIITISDFSKRELIERLGVAPASIDVIPPGIATPAAAGPGSAPRVLYVGSILTRRHVSDLIRAFAPMARRYPAASLDIAGDNRTYPYEEFRQTIRAEGIDEQVRLHSYVPESTLRELYAGARAFAFLSEYEGLGLTPLEALAAGVPSVLLDTAVARESSDGAALYVSLGDLPATTRALERLLFDDRTRTELRAAAPAVLAKYDWRRAAEDTLRAIRQCCR